MPNIQADISLAFDLPPEEAIRFLQKKGYVITFDWKELLDESIARSFTVAGVMKLEILSSLHDMITQAVADGETFEEFRAKAETRLAEAGFSGRQTVTDPATGRTKTVELTPSRLENVFRTNIQSAYNADRYVSQQEVASRAPGTYFYRYNAIRDDRTRPEHLALDGFVAPVEDPVWKRIYPPNGFRCRCSVTMFSARQLRRMGLTPSKGLPTVEGPDGAVTVAPDEGFNQSPTKDYVPDLSRYPKALQALYKEGK